MPTLAELLSQKFGYDPNIQDRPSILPDYRPKEGFVAPEAAISLAKALMLPGHVAQGGEWTPQDATEMALNIGGIGGGIGMAAAPRGALAMGAARRAITNDNKIKVLIKKYGTSDIPIMPKENGQIVSIILPDGRFISDTVDSHNYLLSNAGINQPLDDFLRETGSIRAHGPENFQIEKKPTTQQLQSISRYARASGGGSPVYDFSGPFGNASGSYSLIGERSALLEKIKELYGE